MSGLPEAVERSASPLLSMANATPSHSTQLMNGHSEADATQVNGSASNGADEQDDPDDGDANNEEDSVAVNVGEAPKKKKRSKKSKSKRGKVRSLVGSHEEAFIFDLFSHNRTLQVDSKSTTSTLLSRQRSSRKRKACITCKLSDPNSLGLLADNFEVSDRSPSESCILESNFLLLT
jgi:hypothetical protein